MHVSEVVCVNQFHPVLEKPLIDRARELGYQAFLECRHYSENPFREAGWQRYEAWEEGWIAAKQDNPGWFDSEREVFVFAARM